MNNDWKTIDIPRLCATMRQDRLDLQSFRVNRKLLVDEYRGNNWGAGIGRDRPLNMTALYAGIMGRNLIAKNPRVMLSTFDASQKAAVKSMQLWGNDQIIRMNLEQTLKRIVFDGLFSIGIAMIGLATPADAAMLGWRQKAGGCFVDRVSLDDFVFDTHAQDFSECAYMGHRIRVPLAAVRESKMYGPERKKLEAQYDRTYNFDGDERLASIGRGIYGPTTQEIEDYVDLWIVHVRRHGVILTLADDDVVGAGYRGKKECLLEQKWIGREKGPYEILSYGIVPDNAMPLAPIQNLVDLDRALNNSYRKLIRQANRQKENTFVQGAANEDGSRVMNSNDGDLIKVDNPAGVTTKKWGGPDQGLYQLAVNLKETFDFMAGGLSLMGGLAPQSKTLGQDKMLNENSSHSVKDMQDTTINFTSEVLQAMFWYFWYDPQATYTSEKPISGTGLSVTSHVTPQQRQGPMPDVHCDPYSLQHSTPQMRLAFLNQMVATVQPMMALLQQQGIYFDVNFWLQKVAEYGDAPDLGQMFTIRAPQPAQGGPGGASDMGASGPANTTRNYVRRSIGADTQPAHQSDSMNWAAQGAKQNEEANAA